jgi:DNA helicase IV
MTGLLARALAARIGAAEPAERLHADGRFVTIPGAVINDVLAPLRTAPGPYSMRRKAFRDRLQALLAERGVNVPFDAVLNRLWPQLTAAGFLRDLFNSKDRMLAAAGSEFTADEVMRLRRRSADRLSEEVWSRDDLPLLDEADHLIAGSGKRFDHIVVDEAQDLSPMQWHCIARRSATGSMTLVGDLAQSTGAWAHDSWDSVFEHLPAAQPRAVRQIIFNYRVPSEVFEFVKPLLAVAAPGAASPRLVRQGPAKPLVHRVSAAGRAGVVARVAIAHADRQRFVGIVCPASLRPEVEEVLAANDISWSSADRGELGRAINLVSPQEAKGLEFDAVIVAEPEEIVASDLHGHRLLYVAMTRTTGYLDIVCAGEPLPLKATHDEASTVDTPAMAAPALAHQIAAMLRAHPGWRQVLEETGRLLSAPRE